MIVAPWKEEHGELEVAGRLIERIKSSDIGVGIPSGLGRGEFPAGKLIETVEFPPVISGSPCWLPGAAKRIVFPAGGHLYLQEFSQGFDEPSPPREILPDAAFPNADRVVFDDVLCPTIPEYGGRLLVSIRFKQYNGKRASLTPSQIWSIKLDPTRAAMVSAERMLDISNDRGCDSLPNVAKTADGRHVLAYLNRKQSQEGWTLMLAPIAFDVLKRVPVAVRAGAVEAAHECAFNRPEFSIDGQFVHRIRKPQRPTAPLDRIPVIDTLDGGTGRL